MKILRLDRIEDDLYTMMDHIRHNGIGSIEIPGESVEYLTSVCL